MQSLVAALLALAVAPTPVELEGCLHLAVFFDRGSARLNDEARSMLDTRASGIREMLIPGSWVVIEANADAAGPPAYNLKLSERRGEAVREALASRGVPKGSIFIQAFGETKPSGINPEYDRRAQALVYMPKALWQRRLGPVPC